MSNTCATKPPCTFRVNGATASASLSIPFNGRTYVVDSTTPGDCFDATTGKTAVKGGATVIFHQELRATEVHVSHGSLIATKLTDTAFLTARVRGPGIGKCSEIRPITYSAVATLRR